ncbi:POL-like protein [Mya arenaria]|uniref:POL-like protein n=1 Tax=Mya arenaria TaxID=6604 RepID=A0ABY7FPY3_MYAAR|nr:POL-like protein [Mya arenaria]
MVPIMQVIDSLVAGRDCQESLNFDELVTKLVDAVALTAVGNADANACRRESIKRDLNEEYQAICSNTNPVTQMLFGDNITDQLKSITESNKIGFKTPDAKDRTFRKSGSFFRTTTVSTALSSNTEGEGISSRRTAQGTVQCDSQTTCQTLTSTCNVAEVSYSNINCIKLAGRLKHFGTQREQLTTDKSILETVYACTIEFIDTPNQTHVRETKLNSKETIVLTREIKGLSLKGVIETTEHCDGEFISTVFLRPKSNGSYRVILNLKSLNESIEYIHFKMESLHAAIRLITPGCFMASIDLKDAYYTVNESEEFRKYLRFIWRGQLYQYTCLANGLACAPRKFTKLLKPVFSCLRMKGFPSVVYLDDSYLQGTTYAECLENVSVTQELLADIGFVINNEKSVFIPTQELDFLGFILNSNTMTISLTEQNVQTITLAIQTLQNSANYTIRQVAEIIGKMISYSIAIPYGILYTKVLEQDKTSALKYNKGNFDSHMTLSAESLIDLDWWLKAVKNSGAPLYRDIPVISLTTDASSKGWGAVCEDNSTGGQWTIAEASFKDNINYLELNVVLLVLKAYTLCLREKHVRLHISITWGVPAQNNQHNIWLPAEHVPGKDNYLADRESRVFHDNTEWMLSISVFNRISKQFFPPEIDLFASRLNHRSDRHGTAKSCARQGGWFVGCARLDNADVVSGTNENVCRVTPASSTTETSSNIAICERQTASIMQETKFVNMSCVREQYKDQGLSDNAIDFMEEINEKAIYNVYKYVEYVTENNVQVSSPVVCDVINFLDKRFSEGLTYTVLNTARSAISSFICLQNSEFSVGNHPIISRFMRGAFNMRPALPRYVNTWEVSVVIRYLKQQSPTEKLSFKPLTMKLVMLMALLSGQRAQSLQMLNI